MGTSLGGISLLASSFKKAEVKDLGCLVKLKLDENVKQDAKDENKIKLNF